MRRDLHHQEPMNVVRLLFGIQHYPFAAREWVRAVMALPLDTPARERTTPTDRLAEEACVGAFDAEMGSRAKHRHQRI